MSLDNIFGTKSAPTGAVKAPVSGGGSLSNIFATTPKPKELTPTVVTPPDTASMFPKSSKIFPVDKNTSKNKNTLKELPGAVAENLPFGVGDIVRFTKQDPIMVENPDGTVTEQDTSVHFDDFLHGVIDTSKGVFKGLGSAALSLAMVPIKVKVPVLGEISNVQYNASQKIANGESIGKTILEEGVVNNIFGTLMLAGLANEIAGPRQVTIAKKVNIPNESGIEVTAPAKSFRLYDEPIGTKSLTPVEPAVMEKLISESGTGTSAKYNPELPTFFRMTGKANGNIVAEIVQIKPSILNSISDYFSKNTSAGYATTQRELLTSGHDFDRAIESGDMPANKIYKSPDGTLQPHEIDHVISDLSGKLNDYKPGLGEKFTKIVDVSKPTPTNLIQQASTFLAQTAEQGLGASLPILSAQQIKSIPPKDITPIITKEINPKEVGKIKNEAPKEPELHPTLVKETTEHLATHGEELTAQGLIEKVGASPTEAKVIVQMVKKIATREKLENPEKTSQEILNEISPETLEIEKISAGKFKDTEDWVGSMRVGNPFLSGKSWQELEKFFEANKPPEAGLDNIFAKPAKVSEPAEKKQEPAPPEVIKEHVDYHRYAIDEIKNQLDEHPGKIIQRFMSKKEGQFEDFKNPDYAKTPSAKRAIEMRNKRVMKAIESAVDGTKYADQFDNVDAIREAIEEYKNIQESLQSHKEALSEAKKGNIPRNAQGGFIAPGAIFKDLSSPVNIFLKEDVLPTSGEALNGFKNSMKGLVNVLVPTVGVKPADLDLIMRMKGARDKQEYIFAKTHEIIKKNFSKMTQEEQVDFIDRMKRGEPQPNPGLQAVANGLRIIDTAMWNAVKVYKPSLNWKENHFRVLWKVIPGKPELPGFRGLFTKPLQGTKGFTKQSTLLDMSEGLSKGGVPISYNPIELFTYAYADMNKYLTAQEMIKAFKEQGQMVFVKKGQFPANGYVRLNDSISKVYMPVETKGGKTIVTPAGEWYIEQNIGRLLNNFLSKDYIRSTDIGRGMLAVKNAYTAVELSLSPFHAVFESLETMGSSIGLGIQKISQGRILSGAKDILTFPITPYTDSKLGGDAIRYLTNPDKFVQTKGGKNFIRKYPDAANLLTDLFNGGGRMKMDDTYQISTEKAFAQNIKNKNYIGAALRALPALSKTLTKPLFEIYIPRLKIGTFLKEYSNDIMENSKALSMGKTTREKLARERWNFVEDRFGEMNFDNLFWNKTFKTSMQLLFRSVTWKMGNLRATGGSLAGQGQEMLKAKVERRAPKLHPKFAWLLGMSVITVLVGTIMQELFAKKKPIGIKDIVYPQIDDKGNRISTPTYWKDAYHLFHDPAGYLRSSMTGIIGKITDVWENKDFYGVEVHDPNDSWLKQAEDNMVHLLPVPFSVSSAIAFKQGGAPLSKQLLGFFGFTKAPGYINQNEIQQKIFELFTKRLGGGVISQDDADVKNQKADIRKAYQNGDVDKANQLLDQAVKDGVVKDVDAFITKADLPGDIRAFAALPSGDQRNLIAGMSPDEIEKYAWYVHSDVQENFGEISGNASDFVDKFQAGTVTQTQYKRGAPIEDGTKPVYNAGDQSSNEGVISRVVAYAEALGTDPMTAFHDIFHGQIIRKVNNKTIIVDRMSLADSTAVKKKGGGNNTEMKLDHKIGLQIGGTNEESNLQLVTTEKWASYTPVENYIGEALRLGKIDKKTAQKTELDFKDGLLTFDEIKKRF